MFRAGWRERRAAGDGSHDPQINCLRGIRLPDRLALRFVWTTAGVALAVSLAGAPALTAMQEPVELPPPSELRSLDPADALVIADEVGGTPSGVLELPDGRVVVGYYAEARLQVFDSAGRHVAFWGREGQGPGEFSGVGALACEVACSEAVWALDVRQRRAVAFDVGGGHRETRQLPLGEVASLYPSGFAALGDTVLINGHIPDPGRTGFWMLAVPPDGSVVPAGVAEDRVQPDLRGYYRYRSVAASDSILLVGHRLQLEVEVLDRESLKPSRILSGTRPYFPPLDRDEYLAELANGQEIFRTSGPRTFLQAVALQERVLLLGIRVGAEETWREGRDEFDPNRVWHSVIEAIDLEAEQAIAGWTLDRAVAGFTNRGRPWTYELSEAGIPQIRIFSLDAVAR